MAERTKEIWLARDGDGELYAFEFKPVLDLPDDPDGIWDDNTDTAVELGYDKDIFPEVTYLNSPVKAIVESWHEYLKPEDIALVK